MDFNKSCKLFNRNVFSYDISSCHYQIAKKLGLDLSKIDKNDKKQRNIQIGLMMRNNPKLINVIRQTTESLINEYLLLNDLKEDDLIIRQYDGFITKKTLKITSLSIPIDLRNSFINMIISCDRKMYIANTDEKVIIKGLSKKYEKINKILENILKINFANKSSIFSTLQKIKDDFFDSEDPLLFAIPSSEKNKCYVVVKKYGEIEISDGVLNSMDIDDIDKRFYYDFYIKPFTKSIVLEFI